MRLLMESLTSKIKFFLILSHFRKNKMEIELAESKLELLSLNDQLMEAIQQKMALSQELEQWQVC